VLAGHSFGDLYVLTFAAKYPDHVAGPVLLDSTAAAAGPVPTTNGSYDLFGRISAPVAATANLGLPHLSPDTYDRLPPRSRAESRASVSTARAAQSYIDDFRAAATSARQAATLVNFDSKPLIVVTAGRGTSESHLAAQRQAGSPCRPTAGGDGGKTLGGRGTARGLARYRRRPAARPLCVPAVGVVEVSVFEVEPTKTVQRDRRPDRCLALGNPAERGGVMVAGLIGVAAERHQLP